MFVVPDDFLYSREYHIVEFYILFISLNDRFLNNKSTLQQIIYYVTLGFKFTFLYKPLHVTVPYVLFKGNLIFFLYILLEIIFKLRCLMIKTY